MIHKVLLTAWVAALQVSHGGAWAAPMPSLASSSSSLLLRKRQHQQHRHNLNHRSFRNSIITARATEDTDHNEEEPTDAQENEKATEASESLASVRGGGSVVTATIPEKLPPLPTVQEYLKFALPCLGLWIAGPLLSLVDTSFVGLSGSAETSAQQIAALGPATTFMDGATYLFAFLNVATTNLYSSARAASSHVNNNKKNDTPDLAAESVVRTAARVSLRCGVGIMLFLLLTCRPLLRLYIGEEAAQTPGLLKSASDYVMIRSLHMPTSLLLGVLQAALLGAKDSVTPLIAILYSTIVNVVGDYLLVSKYNMGLPGAAIATTLAQWAATWALLGPARKELVHDHHLGIWGKSRDEKYHTPDPKDMVTSKSFLGFAAPVLTLILGKLAAFGFMTNVSVATRQCGYIFFQKYAYLTLSFRIAFLGRGWSSWTTHAPRIPSNYFESPLLLQSILGSD